MKVYVIFLSYYDNYLNKSLDYLKKILYRTGVEYELIVVNNNIQNSLSKEIKFVTGDNTNWEFSGWDKGLSSIAKLEKEDVVIFCNDTAAFHKPSGIMDKISFARSFRKLINFNKQGICGVVNNSLDEDFFLLECSSSVWVSTYLFALTGGIIKQLNGRISLNEESLSKIVIGIQDNKIIWGEGASDNIKARIQNWLYPLNGSAGWYNEKKVDNEVKLRKVKTILNEKYITAFCISHGGLVINAIPNKVVRRFRILMALPRRIKNRLLLSLEKQ